MFPTGADWDTARRAAGLSSSGHEDMHGGEVRDLDPAALPAGLRRPRLAGRRPPGRRPPRPAASRHGRLHQDRHHRPAIPGHRRQGRGPRSGLVAGLEPHLRLLRGASGSDKTSRGRRPHTPGLGSKMPRKGSSGGAWASRRVVTPGRSAEPPGPQHPPEHEPNASPRPASRADVAPLTNRHDGQACRRDEMPTPAEPAERGCAARRCRPRATWPTTHRLLGE